MTTQLFAESRLGLFSLIVIGAVLGLILARAGIGAFMLGSLLSG